MDEQKDAQTDTWTDRHASSDTRQTASPLDNQWNDNHEAGQVSDKQTQQQQHILADHNGPPFITRDDATRILFHGPFLEYYYSFGFG